jgi:hypothetical protein
MLRDGDRVEYLGPPPSKHQTDALPGAQGTVYVAVDANGDAHINWDRSGVEIWSPEMQRHLRVLPR